MIARLDPDPGQACPCGSLPALVVRLSASLALNSSTLLLAINDLSPLLLLNASIVAQVAIRTCDIFREAFSLNRSE